MVDDAIDMLIRMEANVVFDLRHACQSEQRHNSMNMHESECLQILQLCRILLLLCIRLKTRVYLAFLLLVMAVSHVRDSLNLLLKGYAKKGSLELRDKAASSKTQVCYMKLNLCVRF